LGIGFVDSGETKAMFANPEDPLQSSDGVVKNAQFIDKHSMLTSTLPQDKLVYSSNGKSVMWDAFYVEASVYNDQFTDNRIALHYYEEPTYSAPITETAANVQLPLYISIKPNPRDLDNIIKYGDFKCRFTSSKTTVIVDAIFTYQPMVAGLENFADVTPNTIYCKTPIWPIDDSASKETVKLDVSVNG
jgi:hypothetical protein